MTRLTRRLRGWSRRSPRCYWILAFCGNTLLTYWRKTFWYGNIIHIGLFPSNELRNDLHSTHCDFVAPKSSKLKRHMIKHNPKPPKAEEKCPKCDMTFKYKSDLGRHIPTSHCGLVKGNSRCVLLYCKNRTVHTLKAFLQCDIIVSPQITNKGACITALSAVTHSLFF